MADIKNSSVDISKSLRRIFAASALAVAAIAPAAAADNKQVNESVMADATTNAAALVRGTETAYSKSLQRLAERMTKYLKDTNNPHHSEVIILDPAKFDTGRALGLGQTETVLLMLGDRGDKIDGTVVRNSGEFMKQGPFTTNGGTRIFTQSPHASSRFIMGLQTGDAPEACIVTPSSPHTLMIEIKGLTKAEAVDIINRHEIFHCMAGPFNPAAQDLQQYQTMLNANPAYGATDAGSKMASILAKNEAFSDVAGIGDAIRNGLRVEAMTPYADWRRLQFTGVTDYASTIPALNGLKTEIDVIGLRAFKRMSAPEATQFYIDVVNKYGLSPDEMKIYAGFQNGDIPAKNDIVRQAKTDLVAARMVALAHHTITFAPDMIEKPKLTADQQATLDAFDANRALQDEAFRLGGKVTPDTLVKAYGSLQSRYQADGKDAPADPLPSEKAAKLNQCFALDLATTDFVAVNQRYGVTLSAPKTVIPAAPKTP